MELLKVVESGGSSRQGRRMVMIGTAYLVYVPSHSLKEVAKDFGNLDDYGTIYTVTSNSHNLDFTKPSRQELDAAHWMMFLAILAEVEPELKAISEERGFDACWDIHRLDIQSGEDAVSDARSLQG
jgi:hypothetical protein